MFKALHSSTISLHLIEEWNLLQVLDKLDGFRDKFELTSELRENYLPQYEQGRRVQYGFYATINQELVGFSLLSIDSWKECIGSTGADTPEHMRGRGVAPSCKPHLFYLAFELFQLNRIETGCLVSNIASKRSIEKTPGFQFEGVARESGINDQGQFEDQYIYSILKKDWLRLYNKNEISVEY